MTSKEFIQVVVERTFGNDYVATPPSEGLLMLLKVLNELGVLEILKKYLSIELPDKYNPNNDKCPVDLKFYNDWNEIFDRETRIWVTEEERNIIKEWLNRGGGVTC